jgi:integrase
MLLSLMKGSRLAPHSIRLSEATELYLKHNRARGLEASTIRGQECALKLMKDVAGDLRLDNIEGWHVDKVFSHYNWAATTRNNRIGQYRAFFNWARGSRHMSARSNPMLGWRQRSTPEVARLRIPRHEWPLLFDACVHPQERIVLATGLYLFLRASEQQALTIKDVDLQSNRIAIWRRKTKQADEMPITTELAEELRRWMTWLSQNHILQPQHHLICARTKGDMKRDENHRWIAGTGSMNLNRPFHRPSLTVQRILRRAGYPAEAWQGEHTLRRSGARAYFDHLVADGYDGALRRVQSMLGHRNAMTTEIYLGLDLDKVARNDALAGRPMFPIGSSNVYRLEEVKHG